MRRRMTWVEAERASFAVAFRAADPNAPTLCAGWSARHLCAHLVQREHSILRNVWDQVTTKAPGEERFMRRLVDDAGTPDGYAALVDRFEAGPSRHSLMGRFDEALNLVEYVVHHEDLRRGSGPVPPRDLPAAELDEIWRRARPILKRAYRKAPVGVLARTRRRRGHCQYGMGRAPSPWPVHLSSSSCTHSAGAAPPTYGSTGPSDGVSSFTRWATRA